MRFFAAALIFFGVAASYAQTPEVPAKMHFAGMSLTIRDDARREIQKDVDALTRHKRYFEMNAERARTYFPIIEKIFREEQLPDDFKYLALQESSLTADAVSVSNAVGFWQFKDYTAQEMGMRVDGQIDERMNIVSATRGAAKYLKQSNWRFNNWLLALQSYQMGAGGVERAMSGKYNGDSHMEITSETYWYVKKYLAHKVAFEGACQGPSRVNAGLYETSSKRKLDDIAREVAVDEMLLKEYNKWAKRGVIPDDKPYFLFIPGGNPPRDFNNLVLTSDKAAKAMPMVRRNQTMERMIINGVEAIKANGGESLSAIARRADIDVSRFLRYNDMAIDQEIKAGSYYFLKRKKKKSDAAAYKVKMGDDLWSLSQKFGVRLKSLKKLNAQAPDGLLASGSFIFLNGEHHDNPKPLPVAAPLPPNVESEPDEVAELSGDTFNWGAQPESRTTSLVLSEPLQSVQTDSVKTSMQARIEQSGGDSVIHHEVKQGETLFSIAHQYSVGVSTLIQDNRLDVTKPLLRGQQLTVNRQVGNKREAVEPVGERSDTITYEVKNSDTLYGIARQFGATIQEIMEWNNKSVLTVTTGEKLKILKR